MVRKRYTEEQIIGLLTLRLRRGTPGQPTCAVSMA